MIGGGELGSWSCVGAGAGGAHTPAYMARRILTTVSPGLRGFRLRRRQGKGKTNEGSGVGQVPIVAVGMRSSWRRSWRGGGVLWGMMALSLMPR